MAFELREGQGSLFKNDRKEKPSHADYRGEILIDGKAYWLNAWIKEGKNGKFMSLAANPKDAKPTAPKRDSSIPF